MAAKTKTKSKSVSKSSKKSFRKVVGKPAPTRKSFIKKAKPAKPAPRTKAKPAPKTAPKKAVKSSKKPAPKVEVRDSSRSRSAPSKTVPVQKSRVRENGGAVKAYELALKFMHNEEYEKAIKAFNQLIATHSDEPEIQERARVLMHASENRLHERRRMVLKSADDHYNMGIAELNRRQLDAAIQHLQHALKLAPKGDHILYAMAAVNALKGNRDEALTYLKQSIHHRPENRFMALRDSDFETLIEDVDFKQLVASSEK